MRKCALNLNTVPDIFFIRLCEKRLDIPFLKIISVARK
jgi:hypothetical protein